METIPTNIKSNINDLKLFNSKKISLHEIGSGKITSIRIKFYKYFWSLNQMQQLKLYIYNIFKHYIWPRLGKMKNIRTEIWLDLVAGKTQMQGKQMGWMMNLKKSWGRRRNHKAKDSNVGSSGALVCVWWGWIVHPGPAPGGRAITGHLGTHVSGWIPGDGVTVGHWESHFPAFMLCTVSAPYWFSLFVLSATKTECWHFQL